MLNFAWNDYEFWYDKDDYSDLRANLGSGFVAFCNEVGFENEPGTFQRMLNDVWKGIPFVRVYIDDIDPHVWSCFQKLLIRTYQI